MLKQLAFTIVLSFLCLPAAAAEELTNQQRIKSGHKMAAQWCAHCHAISPESSEKVQADVPSFDFIASKPGQTRETVENGILDPHPPMPDLRLSREAVSNLALYILSLRQPGDQ